MDGSDWPQTKPYRPSNGTEGMMFEDRFCDRCKRDAKYRRTQDGKDGCRILALVGAYQAHEPEYPKEWVQNAHGDPYGATARCTAFQFDDPNEPRPRRPRKPKPAPLLELIA
jgi:hypothetical protein